MCAEHFKAASTTSRAETLTKRAGLAAGVLTGILCAASLLAYWGAGGQGSLLLNIPLAVFVGAGFSLIIWAATAFWLAPLLAPASARACRDAVRISRYWPAADILELEFTSSQASEGFISGNTPLLIEVDRH
jgi:hypothetical protein